ncbi:replicative DNA helicase [Candidatus Venteria ishoeyi]|uniref:replicative DNA helicase n=1 Tax=Candidatus Venteria ishoeyi TaxID=1899563 RepID=UPI0025A65C7C|nr:replicative DNA helicase [Candidatus Venteria ishoeyi]MDM8548344.1 replicative DNA helicase [Candidatus Venteria ishoeyi]
MNEDFPATPEVSRLKIPPHSIEAEQSVLGGLMLDNEAWIQIADRITEQDFYRRDHQLIFNAIHQLLDDEKPCDVVTLSEWLEQNNQLDAAGDLLYLGTLAKNTPSAANIGAYADIVRERSVLRQLIQTGTQITNNAFQTEGRSIAELLDEAESLVFAIAEQGKRQGGFVAIKQLLAEAVDKIDTLFHQDNAITGISTGYADFDEKTSGLQPSDMVIVAGRPSMGKTSYAINIAEHVAIHEQMPVAVFSMEMPGEQLAMRLMSSLGRIDQHKVRTGKLDDDDWPRLTSAISMLAETPLFIDDTPALSPTELRARSRRLMREHGQLGLIVIDYLQLMQVPGKHDNRTSEVSEISRSLKALAKELNVPVMALSQLNRGLEQRPNKRPIMSDLRECVTAETKVVLSNGQRVPIKELVGTQPELYTLNEAGKFITTKSDKVWKVGHKPVYKVHLASGKSIRATAEHRLMTDLSWKKIKDIQVGNQIALAPELPGQANNDLFWDQVVLIEADGEEDVYDLSVPVYENWLADGIVSHNSGAIEQDADLIVFIYRDEVYNEDSEAKGTAEIIIAKQRNGPIGTVRLAFLGQYTRFENFTGDLYEEEY